MPLNVITLPWTLPLHLTTKKAALQQIFKNLNKVKLKMCVSQCVSHCVISNIKMCCVYLHISYFSRSLVKRNILSVWNHPFFTTFLSHVDSHPHPRVIFRPICLFWPLSIPFCGNILLCENTTRLSRNIQLEKGFIFDTSQNFKENASRKIVIWKDCTFSLISFFVVFQNPKAWEEPGARKTKKFAFRRFG